MTGYVPYFLLEGQATLFTCRLRKILGDPACCFHFSYDI